MADRRLQVFNTVAKLLSFTKAADALHMTQPAVTFQIRQLENHFNVRLFNRTHNRISLTDAGLEVLSYSSSIIDMYTEMNIAIKTLTGDNTGTIIIGANTTIAEYFLPSLLSKFKDKHPLIKLRLVSANSEQIIKKVENNEIDLGVIETTIYNKKLQVTTFKKDEVVLIVNSSHELAQTHEIRLKDTMKYPYVLRELGSGTRQVVYQKLEENGLDFSKINIAMEMSSPESIKGAVEAGIGVSLMSRSCVAKEIKLGILKEIRLIPRVERNFSFIYQKQKFRISGIETFLKFSLKNYRDSK